MTTSLKEKMQPAEHKEATVQQVLANPSIRKRIEEVLGKRAPQFASSIINLIKMDPKTFAGVNPVTIVQSAMVAATLDLPIDPNLGYAWVVPYKGRATFQMGYKGYVQLALRSGQYKAINVIDIHEGELVRWDPLSEEIEVDFAAKKSDAIVGYAAHFELINGFKKTTYWPKEQIKAHKRKFVKSDFGWSRDYDAMARKTVLKDILSKWGILSIQMQSAVSQDAIEYTDGKAPVAVQTEDGDYIDIDATTVDHETGEELFDGMTSAELDAQIAAEEADGK